MAKKTEHEKKIDKKKDPKRFTVIKGVKKRGRRRKKIEFCHCGGKRIYDKKKELYQEDFLNATPLFNLHYSCDGCDETGETYYIEDDLYVDMPDLE